MSVKLDWQVGESEDEPEEVKRRKWPVSSLTTIIAAFIVAGLALGAWGVSRDQAAKAEAGLMDSIQAMLDLEQEAYLRGDGDLFFANQDEDPAWLSAQLRPENQAANRAGLAVTRAESLGEDIWANVSWTAGGQSLQKVAFFQRRDGRLVHVPTAVGYWGPIETRGRNWGVLRLHEADREWAAEIADFVSQVVEATCPSSGSDECPAGRLPFTLTVAGNYATTAAPNELRLPSPRLQGLDQEGDPAGPFWNRLRREIEAQLKPTRIRYALPEEEFPNTEHVVYEQLAFEFSRLHPDNITVEIVSQTDLSDDPLVWPAEVDGAAIVPSEAMLAAGLVYDLTDYANTDPEFEAADFYEQVWQGSLWRERMWLVPTVAEMGLVFYDKEAYRRANRAEPMLRWTWDEMAEDLRELVKPETADPIQWSYLDLGRDTLFSYAFNWDNPCTSDVPARCQQPLRADGIAAALAWYLASVSESNQMVDLSGLTAGERAFHFDNLMAPPRNVAVWVEGPVNYELHSLRQPIGVIPFPGSDRFDGITPLWVQGGFISQYSQYPRATWEWLKFLSYRHLNRQKRFVPARPSVAEEKGYWLNLPRPLGEAMRTAFPFGRPVRIEERELFSWELLAAVASGEQSPQEAAHSRLRLLWFASNKQ